MFQKQHFEAIAQMMQELKPQRLDARALARDETLSMAPPALTLCFVGAEHQWIATVNALSSLFARHNSRFSLGRFERACEPGANVRARRASVRAGGPA